MVTFRLNVQKWPLAAGWGAHSPWHLSTPGACSPERAAPRIKVPHLQ